MATKRLIEVFSAGCPLCDGAVDLVKRVAGPSGDVTVHDLHDPTVARRAAALGIRSAPAILVDGTLASCCAGGPDEADLRRAGLGQPR